MGTMRALAIEGFDSTPGLIDVPEPEPGAGEVLVRMRAAALNPYDTFVAMGAMREYMSYEFPAVLGTDLAGTVEVMGEDVEGFSPGTRVFGTMGMKGVVRDGTIAQMATPQVASIAVMPEDVDDEQAATIGVAGTSAMSAVDAVDPSAGTTLLVLGATGGVGSFAIQLASASGALVIASVRPGDEDFVTGLGAAETVDYTGDVVAAVRDRFPDGLDGLIDLVHRDHDAFASMTAVVRAGGRATSVVGGAGDATEIGGVSVSNVGGNPAHLHALADRIAAGSLRAAIRRTYPLDDAAQGMADLTNEHTLGKLVITMV